MTTEPGLIARRRRSRRRALQGIYQWQMAGHEAGDIIAQFQEQQNMSEADAGFFEQLLRGVIARQDELDDALRPLLDRPFEQLEQMERAVLRMGAFELLHCPETPWRVVIDEAVDLSLKFGSEQAHSYINAVLDRAARAFRPQEVADSSPADG